MPRPQEYSLTIRLTSKVALLKQMNDDSPGFLRRAFFAYTGGGAVTAEITVMYVDYIVARAYIEAFDEWVSGCQVTPRNRVIDFLRGYSHYFQDISHISLALLIVFFGIQSIPAYFTPDAMPANYARFVVVYCGGAYILMKFMKIVADFVEQTVDQFPDVSYLKLNKGDERIIEEAKHDLSKVIWRLVFGGLGSVVISVIASQLKNLL